MQLRSGQQIVISVIDGIREANVLNETKKIVGKLEGVPQDALAATNGMLLFFVEKEAARHGLTAVPASKTCHFVFYLR